jgi:hypothetical protein
MTTRILIEPLLLDELSAHYVNEVPITKLIKRYKLNVSRITLTRLIQAYLALKASPDNDVIAKSLFPAFTDDQQGVYRTPPNYKYEGIFPFGYWIKQL